MIKTFHEHTQRLEQNEDLKELVDCLEQRWLVDCLRRVKNLLMERGTNYRIINRPAEKKPLRFIHHSMTGKPIPCGRDNVFLTPRVNRVP